MKRYDYDCIHGKLVEHSQGTFYLAADVEAMKAGAQEKAEKALQSVVSAFLSKPSSELPSFRERASRLIAAIFEEGK